MKDQRETATASSGDAALYGQDYYASHCGPFAYDRSHPHWAAFFGKIADELIRMFRPRRVFDAGCAHGFLVEAFWDRGVSAWGRDISDFAISQVRADVQPHCAVGSLTDPIDGRFDLIACIEVLEHMSEAEGALAIANLAAAADRIVFSSSPSDFDEPTHVNVRPAIYWMRQFAQHRFWPAIEASLPTITPYALVFERRDDAPTEEVLGACAEVVRLRIQAAQDQHAILAAAGDHDRLSAEHTRVVAERQAATDDRYRALAERDSAIRGRDTAAEQRDKALFELGQIVQRSDLAASVLRGELLSASASLADATDELAQVRRVYDAVQRSVDFRLARRMRSALDRLPTWAGRHAAGRLLGPDQAGPGDAMQQIAAEDLRPPGETDEIDFDAAYYVKHNPDVLQHGFDPLDHYLTVGWAEGRLPSLRAWAKANNLPYVELAPQIQALLLQAIGFDEAYYTRTNQDVLASGADPLQHYLEFGRIEGRQPSAKVMLESVLPRLSDLCDPDRDEVSPRISDDAFCVSVLTPAYNTDPRYLRELFQTLANQRYGNWEWIVVDDGSTQPATLATLRELVQRDPRVRLILNPKNLGISGASNAALAAARGTHAALVDHDDLVSRDAFLAIYEAWKRSPATQLFYTDECKILTDGTLGQFWAKPGWSPAYLENTMCILHVAVYEMGFIRELGGFRPECDGTQDYDLALRASLTNPKVVHVPVFAYLWRIIPGSTAADLSEKPYAVERQRRAVFDYARQRHPAADVVAGWAAGYWRILYPLPSPAPLLSYVIPTGGGSRSVRGRRIDLVTHCVNSFIDRQFYPNVEFVVIHNGDLSEEQTGALQQVPDLRLVHYEAPAFNFSQKLNLGVSHARGQYLCLLNDDIEAITPQGGEELVRYLAANPQVGAIGPMCLQENDTIQQNGVVLLDVGPAHAGDKQPVTFGGHQHLLRCRREAFCIGGAILFTRKASYDLVGGFDEDLPLNYNDVDFGLKLRQQGLSSIVDPQVQVYHYEGATKVGTSTVEQERLFLKHPDAHDPYYSHWFDQGDPNYRLAVKSGDGRRGLGAWLDRTIPQRASTLVPHGRPKLSVCVSVYNQPKRLLEEMYQSVLMQTYANRELVILDNGSSNPETLAWIETARRAGRATVVRAEDNLGISGGNLRLLEAMTGDFFVAMDADDFLSIDALQVMAHAIETHPDKKFFYSDEYKSDLNSSRFQPFFKPDFDPLLLTNCCYPAHLMAMRADFLREIGSYTDARATWCHDYDTLTRALAAGEEPGHVRELIYAWRINPGSTASAETFGKPETVESQRLVLTRLLAAKGLADTLSLEPNRIATSTGMWRLKAVRPIPNIGTFEAGAVWGKGGCGVAGLAALADKPGIDWIAVLISTSDGEALLDLSALAWFDERVTAVSGLLIDDGVLRWSGAHFLPGGRLFDPYVGQQFASGGYHGQLWCQRCVDLAAPINVLIRASALVRVAAEFAPDGPDALMTSLGLAAQERGELVAVTPHLQAATPPGAAAWLPVDRAGRLIGKAALADGSRWYDGRLEVERPYRRPGLA